MKLINPTEKPFEFTWDSVHTIVKPGQIIDLPDAVAHRVLRQSEVLDTTFERYSVDGNVAGEGIPTGESRLRPLSEVDAAAVKSMLRFDCPYHGAGLCSDGPFRTVEDLRAHIDTHVGPPAADFELAGAVPARKK